MLNKQVRIILAVSNDLSTDVRVHKMCMTLHNAGYSVLLLGRKIKKSKELPDVPYQTHRFSLWWETGFLFYVSLQIRLFFFCMQAKVDVFTANDLDTLPALYCASVFRRKKIVYDSHEYFTEIPELQSKPFVKSVWESLERVLFPRVSAAITVCDSIADVYSKKYGLHCHVVRNLPYAPHTRVEGQSISSRITKPFILYQGAVNVGRGLPELVAACAYLLEYQLVIIGDGNYYTELQQYIQDVHMQDRVICIGRLHYSELAVYTQSAEVGVSLEEAIGLNYYYSLPNKLFDYIHAGIPVVVSDFPEMRKIVTEYACGVVVSDRNPQEIAKQLAYCISNKNLFKKGLEKAKTELCWEQEEATVLSIYSNIFAKK